MLAAGVFFLCAVAYFWARSVELPMLRGPDGHYVLSDPDSFVRWRLVERALAGEGVRIRWMNEDNAPYGRLNAWTSPMTVLGVTLVRFAEMVGRRPRQDAMEWAGTWLGPLVGLITMVALGVLGWRAGGWLLAASWILAWPVLLDVISITGFGNTDHHSLHQLLFVCVTGGCFAWARRPTAAGGVFVGLACAMLIWSAGLEALPAWALVAGLAMYELGFASGPEEAKRFWRGWWVSGFIGTTVAWLFEFWPRVFHGHLEFISVWHVVSWAIIGVVLEFIGRPQVAGGWKVLAVGIGFCLAVLVAAATRGFDWNHLIVLQDDRLRRLMLVTTECQPYPRAFPLAIQRGCMDFGLLPVVAATLVFALHGLERRAKWLGLATLAYAGLTFFQVRWVDFFVPLLAMTAGVVVCHWRGRDPVLCLAVILVATGPPWMVNLRVAQNAKLAGNNPMRGPYVEVFALRAVSDCLSRSGHPLVLLAPWEQSSILAGMGKVKVIGSGFWPNLDGLTTEFEMWTTSSEEQFVELAAQRGIRYVLLRSPEEMERDVREAFVARSGRPPTSGEAREAFVWQLRNNHRFPSVDCEQMSRLTPNWKIVQVIPNR